MEYGTLLINRKKCVFLIQEEILRIAPIVGELPNFLNTFYWDPKTLNINTEHLKGHLLPNQELILIEPRDPSFSIENNAYKCRIRSFFILSEPTALINTVSFHTPELNFIYDYHKAIERTNFSLEGDLNVEIKGFEDSTLRLKPVTFRKKVIEPSLGISRTLTYNKTKPIIGLSSRFILSFEGTRDVVFIKEVIDSALNLIRYLCYRRNISVQEIKLHGEVDGQRREVGRAKILDLFVSEPDITTLSKYYMPIDKVETGASTLFQEIIDKKLNLRNLPETERAGRIVTPSFFLMIASTFEGEFERCFPNFNYTKDESATVFGSVKNELDKIISITKGEVRSILKDLKNQVGQTRFKQKIIAIGEKYPEIGSTFMENLYKDSDDCFNLKKVAERLRVKRNDFAHGKLKIDFDSIHFVDLLYLQIATYYMQLRSVGISQEYSLDALSKLFQLEIPKTM